MEKTEVIVNSRGVRRRSEYRQRRIQKKAEEEKRSSFSDAMMIRIILCILIGGIGSIALNSDSEKAQDLKSELNQVLNKNISFEDLSSFKESFNNLKDKSITSFGFNNEIEIESDYIDEMNAQEVFYQNQKK